MTTIQYAGNVTKDAIAFSSAAPAILKLNLARFILAKEAGIDPSGLSAFDLDAPLDERITWVEESDDNGVTVTGTLEVTA